MDPVTGGPCQGIRNMVPELNKYGIESEVVCLDPCNAPFLKDDLFTVHALGSSRGYWKYHPTLYSWLISNMLHYDVILVRGLWLFHSFAVTQALLHLKRRKVKQLPRVYVVPHGMLDPWFQRAQGRKWKSLRNIVYWHLIEKRVVENADGLLFTCASELLLARNTFSGYKPKVELNIGYGIQEPPAHEERMLQLLHEKVPESITNRYLLFLGRLHEKKGIDVLLEAYRQLLRDGVDLPVLVIAGPGLNTLYGDKIRSVVDEDSNLREKVIFTGMLTGVLKWSAIYHAAAFVLPSHQENFGIAVVEALACGKPVLITNQINIYSDIQKAKAGFVVPDTLTGVVTMLRTWIQLPEVEKMQLSQNAKDLYRKEFTVESAALKMIQMLRLKHL
jgi:glycosyltransferase involved in cell wall biosynthesis